LRWVNRFGAAFVTYIQAYVLFNRLNGASCVQRWSEGISQFEEQWCAYIEILTFILCAAFVIYFTINEVDRQRSDRTKHSATQLCESGGTIADARGLLDLATCSVASDRKAILDEIDGRLEDVSKAVHVLVCSGMSTSRLRNASLAGVELEDAAHTESGGAFMFCALGVMWTTFLAFLNGTTLDLDLDLLLVCLSPCCCMVCAHRFWVCKLPPDERAFTFRSVNKLVGLYMPYLVVVGVFTPHTLSYHAAGIICNILFIGDSILIMSISFAGIDRIARVPCCGRRVAQILASRGFTICRSGRRAR
jgi:hypothetical protein